MTGAMFLLTVVAIGALVLFVTPLLFIVVQLIILSVGIVGSLLIRMFDTKLAHRFYDWALHKGGFR